MNTPPRLIVWIVDDATSVRKSIGAVLETASFVVKDFGSAAEFLANFSPIEPSCLIVDHHMPDMTGLELLLHLRRKGICLPVIVITGGGDQALEEKALQAGALTLLHKPVDGDELIALIQSLMAVEA